jgi:hypothetical protein
MEPLHLPNIHLGPWIGSFLAPSHTGGTIKYLKSDVLWFVQQWTLTCRSAAAHAKKDEVKEKCLIARTLEKADFALFVVQEEQDRWDDFGEYNDEVNYVDYYLGKALKKACPLSVHVRHPVLGADIRKLLADLRRFCPPQLPENWRWLDEALADEE